MIEILPESEDDTLAVRISGELTSEDYQKIEPELRLRAERPKAFDVLVLLEDIEGMEPSAVRDDLRFTKDFAGSIRRMAVVTGDPVWRGLSDFVGKPVGQLLGMEVERFDDRVEAWKWLRD